MLKNRILPLLLAIIVLASILRLFQLGKTPNGLEWDEVALGYDAYSILRTGKDQFGHFLPLTFRSIDDYKPPLYIYSAVPAIALFGLTEFATRLPTALFGIAAVILTYFLVVELFRDQGNVKIFLALISALFLAISPWHLQFSRAAFETNLSVTVTIAAVLFFLKGINGNNKKFLFSAVLFGLALFSYHSARVVTPALLLSLFIIFHKTLPPKKVIVSFLIIYAFFVYFFIPIVTSADSEIRFTVTNILNIQENQDQSAKLIQQDEKAGALFAAKIFHNRRLAVFNYQNFQQIAANYIVHFSPEFLFVKGDVPLHHAPGFGMMYFFDLPLLIIGGLFYIFKYRDRRSLILPIWLFLGPLPASVTWQVPHAVRSEIILPTLQIISAIGLWEIIAFIRKESKILALLSSAGIALLFIYGVGAYLHQYYIHTNIELSENWLYGRKEATTFTENIKADYNRVIVSPKIDMPYIFWLFYSKYPPEKLLASGGTVSGGFAEERNHFDKYEFHKFSYDQTKSIPGILLVGTAEDFPKDLKTLKTIYYLDGKIAIKIVGTNTPTQ